MQGGPLKDPDIDDIQTDARTLRTRARLAEAVLSLAIERDVTTASVAELTRRAGINRSTFYEHAESPVQLLTRILSADLDTVRSKNVALLDADHRALNTIRRTGVREVVEHALRYEAIYGGGHASSAFALRVVLAEHLEHSALILIQKGVLKPPIRDEVAAPIFAAFHGHGLAAAIEAWLRLPAPRDIELILDAVEGAYPAWLAHAADTAAPEGDAK